MLQLSGVADLRPPQDPGGSSPRCGTTRVAARVWTTWVTEGPDPGWAGLGCQPATQLAPPGRHLSRALTPGGGSWRSRREDARARTGRAAWTAAPTSCLRDWPAPRGLPEPLGAAPRVRRLCRFPTRTSDLGQAAAEPARGCPAATRDPGGSWRGCSGRPPRPEPRGVVKTSRPRLPEVPWPCDRGPAVGAGHRCPYRRAQGLGASARAPPHTRRGVRGPLAGPGTPQAGPPALGGTPFAPGALIPPPSGGDAGTRPAPPLAHTHTHTHSRALAEARAQAVAMERPVASEAEGGRSPPPGLPSPCPSPRRPPQSPSGPPGAPPATSAPPASPPPTSLPSQDLARFAQAPGSRVGPDPRRVAGKDGTPPAARALGAARGVGCGRMPGPGPLGEAQPAGLEGRARPRARLHLQRVCRPCPGAGTRAPG